MYAAGFTHKASAYTTNVTTGLSAGVIDLKLNVSTCVICHPASMSALLSCCRFKMHIDLLKKWVHCGVASAPHISCFNVRVDFKVIKWYMAANSTSGSVSVCKADLFSSLEFLTYHNVLLHVCKCYFISAMFYICPFPTGQGPLLMCCNAIETHNGIPLESFGTFAPATATHQRSLPIYFLVGPTVISKG